jgi:ERCC4-related helicase
MGASSQKLISRSDSLPDYIIAALHRAGLSRRRYQEMACLEALRLLRSGENAEINLPPGTGKTLISQIIGCIWSREGEATSAKVLCIVPTSILREQHYGYCVWWAGESGLCQPLEFTSDWVRRKGIWHQKKVEQGSFWFALPELFYNAVQSAHVPFEILDTVGLVIFDEYDAFSIGVLRAEGHKLRFTKDSERLIQLLEHKERRYLLMSATPAQHRSDE